MCGKSTYIERGCALRGSYFESEPAPARRQFVEEALAALDGDLKHRGSRLLVCEAAPEAALPARAGRGGIVLATGEVCQEEQTFLQLSSLLAHASFCRP